MNTDFENKEEVIVTSNSLKTSNIFNNISLIPLILTCIYVFHLKTVILTQLNNYWLK